MTVRFIDSRSALRISQEGKIIVSKGKRFAEARFNSNTLDARNPN